MMAWFADENHSASMSFISWTKRLIYLYTFDGSDTYSSSCIILWSLWSLTNITAAQHYKDVKNT